MMQKEKEPQRQSTFEVKESAGKWTLSNILARFSKRNATLSLAQRCRQKS